MYGLISKVTAVVGKREELIAILLSGISDMPGCLCRRTGYDRRRRYLDH
jgi:hypothetical protein